MEILLCPPRNVNKYVDFKPRLFPIVLNVIREDEALFLAFADSADVLWRWI